MLTIVACSVFSRSHIAKTASDTFQMRSKLPVRLVMVQLREPDAKA